VCNSIGYAEFLDPADSGLMHKLIVTLRKVARGEEATIETVESTSGREELVFLVGPRAAGFSVDRASRARTVNQKTSADR
jgi:hypothetical protein